MSADTPMGLWQQALSEFPEDETARRLRYFELMIEAGHLLPPEPDDGLRRMAEDRRHAEVEHADDVVAGES